MRDLGIDLSGRRPQLLTRELAEQADLIVTMGCGDACHTSPASATSTGTYPTPRTARPPRSAPHAMRSRDESTRSCGSSTLAEPECPTMRCPAAFTPAAMLRRSRSPRRPRPGPCDAGRPPAARRAPASTRRCYRRASTSPVASSTIATAHAWRARSIGAARRAASRGTVDPSESRCSPVSKTVRRRSSRTGVLRLR